MASDGGLSCLGAGHRRSSDGLVGGLGRVLAVDSRTASTSVHSSVRLIDFSALLRLAGKKFLFPFGQGFVARELRPGRLVSRS